MMPKLQGWEVCREIRRTNTVPVIMLTARGEELDRVLGLELGADDYIVKPFSFRELLARIHANLRRVSFGLETTPTWQPQAPNSQTAVGPLAIDRDRYIVTRDGKPVALTNREIRPLNDVIGCRR